ncbi:hypothetical protein FH063_003000 [Azospirillum argentinense]|uniref:histidine kinase n=1 Tax=Azospirillum argentinense TaxID=2970906 RepID=A0A5B0KMF9_9PROT|nr:hypothetical protein FH063_003000 [Azospirillum argentinense]
MRMAETLRNGEGTRLRITGPEEVSWDLNVAALDGGPSLLVTLRPAESESTETAHHHAREVSHRVKNTLQLVSSLLTLQTLSAKDPDMRRAFQEACSRIGTVTQAHQRVHAAARGSLVDFGAYLSDACREMESHFAVGGPERSIAVTVEQAMVPVDSVIPLALILNELVGNASKYAYAAGSPGNIEVSLVPRDEGGAPPDRRRPWARPAAGLRGRARRLAGHEGGAGLRGPVEGKTACGAERSRHALRPGSAFLILRRL